MAQKDVDGDGSDLARQSTTIILNCLPHLRPTANIY